MRAEVPVGHVDFGKAQPCQCQEHSSGEQSLFRLQRYSNMGQLTRLTFDSLDPNGQSQNVGDRRMFRAAYDASLAYAHEPGGWLVLAGPSGCGKTHLAASVANRCMERGVPALFVTVPDLLDHLRSTYAPSAHVSYDELFEQVKNSPLLVLDDLGTENTTSWAKEKLFQLLNHRFSDNLPTVVTTSIALRQMEDRLRTRLSSDISRIMDMGFHRTSGLPDLGMPESALLKRMAFASFDVRGNRRAGRKQQEALESALHLAKTFAEDAHGWLVFLGPTGTGKTHLAVAIYSQLAKAGVSAYFTRVPTLIYQLRSSMDPEVRAQQRISAERIFEALRSAPVLFLDHLVALNPDKIWAHEMVYHLLLARYDAEAPTVVTARALQEDTGGALLSRFTDPRRVSIADLDVPDYRDQARRISEGPPLKSQTRRPDR